ncbi:Lrp/AsnC family transcriptional regulator [Agrobacterium rosae]|uniref:Leucine-responsive regulatory protein n=1 Tax=Agrobacterium rosae TaxID=1972867 RepID=A0A1R3U672_9HYPH|nr:Lrp/AsnC family transcriptional regulator [Agrobacterium rosae]MBN7808634.1 Lrp/AsnC family transcriptional regulator [Agrobacterium rosae]MCM2435596.1 Lrp/AsnC family transcriptional regulator [Agrobacterium rosae]MDX8304716.1 Lrp/AsnC family transcriptional regulator [Agrobacterium rosae]MDX8331662.1 Lrp/AsnC family transcriptional regulator [Agrobacterium rosae]SCX34297.1 Leucine-responsive regulatory protein [Agrobacterium rosae]
MKLDAIDLRILEAVRRDGRMTKQALAEQIGLSPTPGWARLKRLEAAGIISGYHARIDRHRIAPFTRVLVEITLVSHRQTDFALFEQAIAAIPEITACWSVGGGVDYFLSVETTNIDSYQRLIDRILGMEIGIQRYFTYIVTKTVKDETG